jgi:DNA-binding MarR family transcriptional regulator
MHSGLYGALEALLRRCEEVEATTPLSQVTLSDAAYLAAIGRHGRLGVSAVARLLMVSQPAATIATSKLSRLGLVRRHRTAKSAELTLTEEGSAMLGALAASEEEVIAGVFDVLTPEDRAQLLSLMGRTFSLNAERERGDHISSAPRRASTTWAVQQTALDAAPDSTADSADDGQEVARLVRRGRPIRSTESPTQNPRHIGHDKR